MAHVLSFSLSPFNFGFSQASKWCSVLQGKNEGGEGRGRRGGRQRRDIWKKSSLTVQLFANS